MTNVIETTSETYIRPEFRNESKLSFTDISSELYREYIFIKAVDGTPMQVPVRIDYPYLLNVSKTGGHRIFDMNGECHYIPSGWIHLHWAPKHGEPHFVK